MELKVIRTMRIMNESTHSQSIEEDSLNGQEEGMRIVDWNGRMKRRVQCGWY